LLSVTTQSGAVIHVPIRIGTTPEIRHGYRLGQSLGGGVYHKSLHQLVHFYARRNIMVSSAVTVVLGRAEDMVAYVIPCFVMNIFH
jgi:hypothetical protein